MLVYYILILLIAIFGIVFKENKKMFFVLSGILIFAVIGFRSPSVGNDTKRYLDMYIYRTEYYIDYFKTTTFDKILLNDYLYFIYSSIMLNLGVNTQTFLIISGALVTITTCFIYYKYSDIPYICILSFLSIGLFTFYLSALRQGIAVAIIALSYKYIIEKKPVHFVVTVLIASGFHLTALVFLPAYFIVVFMEKKSLVRFSIVFSIGCILIIGLFYSTIYQLDISPRFSKYLSDDIVRTNPIVVVMYALIIAFTIMIYEFNTETYKSHDKTFFVLSIVGLGIMILSLQNTIISRFSYYYLLCLPVVIVNSIAKVKDGKEQMIYSLACFEVELLYFYYTVPNSILMISDYKFFWQ